MTSPAVTPGADRSPLVGTLSDRDMADFWWVWLVTGVAWIVAALVVLQFDAASITTIAVILGSMLTFAGIQQMLLAAMGGGWLWAAFGVVFLLGAVLCFVNPESTFAGLADMLGFIFASIAIWWTVEAIVSQGDNPLWWLGLTSGIMMFVLAFWVGGQFFIEKAYVLLVCAGIWALMKGVTDIVRAFAVRSRRTRPA